MSSDCAEPVYTFSDGLITCMTGDVVVSYRCITRFTLTVRAWWRKMRLDYCNDMHIDVHSDTIRLIDIFNYVLDDERRFLSCMDIAYPGSTEIQRWYNDCPSEIMEEALAHFFVTCLSNRRQSK